MEKTKKEKKFNFVDLALLIVIVVIAAALIFSYVSPLTKRIFEKEYDIEYTLKLHNVRGEFKDKIQVGDKIVETGSLDVIGEVTDAPTYRPVTVRMVSNDNPGQSTVQNNMYYDVTVRVKAKASMPSGMYEVNGFSLTAGKQISFRVPNFIGEAVCSSVKETGEGK